MPNNYEEVDTFLEHYGVKGMKWGVRKETRSNRKFSERSKKAQIAIAGTGLASYLVGRNFIRNVLTKNSSGFIGPIGLANITALSGGIVSAKVGSAWVANFIDRKTPMSDIKK